MPFVMSLAELKDILDKTGAEERLFARAYLKHLQRAEDPAYRAEITRRLDGGRFFGLDQVREIHTFMAERGL